MNDHLYCALLTGDFYILWLQISTIAFMDQWVNLVQPKEFPVEKKKKNVPRRAVDFQPVEILIQHQTWASPWEGEVEREVLVFLLPGH